MDLVEELRDDFLMCNICFEEYREPKQLPCLHTFCRQCLSKYIVNKVIETGAEWFPCPFCRKAIQPLQGGEIMSWADSFPTNFLLSQLSSKLQEKLANYCGNPNDLSTERDVGPRIKCSEHPQFNLVAYCTRQKKTVCEQCCTQKHTDCIRSHVRERDSRLMAEERRTVCQESLGALQIKLEGIKDRINTRETDLTNRKEQLTLQTEAAMTDIKTKFDQFFTEHKRELSTKLENFLSKEKNRLETARHQAAELAKFFQKLSEKLESLENGSLSIKDLVVLDRAHDELRRQEQEIEKLRKDCSPVDIQFYPNNDFDKMLKGMTIGTLTVEHKSQASGGARPRVHRYTSDPSSSVSQFLNHDHSVSLPAQRASPDVFENAQQSRNGSKNGRALSPSGAASSALSSSPSTAAGPTSGDSEPSRETRRRSEGPTTLSSSRRAPTVPDFGSVLIEESRRSRSAPRRARPVSEGSFSGSSRRRGAPMETAIDSSSENVRRSERNSRTVERGSAGGSTQENQVGGTSRSERRSSLATHSSDLQQLPPGEDLLPFDSNVDYVASGEEGATNGTAEDQDSASLGSGTTGQSSRKILCVRHFLANHGSDMKNQPGLVGISAVCKDRVAVSDRWNKVVKLVDISGRVMDVLVISGDAEPWDLALRRPGVLAVTYPKEQKIRMVDIMDGGSRMYYRSHFLTRDGYASLASYDPTTLVASVCPPFGSPKIHIIDYIGAVLRSIDCSNVAYPRCVDMCGGDEVCVSDWTHHNVKVFSRDGTTCKYTYSGVPGIPDTQLKAPMGVAWNGRNHIFIVDGKTSKLHAVNTQTGQCSAIFSLPQVTGAELKLVTFVEASPELCRSERALVVTTTSGSVQVYDLCNAF